MGINLTKGQKINIGQTNVTIGLGWKPNEGTGQTFDLDCSVFMLNSNGLIPNENNFIFFNNTTSPDGAVKHTGDDRTGSNSAGGDDEQIIVDVNKMSQDIKELLFIATIHDAVSKGQNFGQVKECYIRIIDNNDGQEIAKFDLGEDFSIETSIEFGRLYVKDGQWKFDASGIGYREELSFFVGKYYQGTVTQ